MPKNDDNLEFRWFLGVVEDNNDPLGMKRCKVRVMGKHSGNQQLIPTGTLPWAFDSRSSLVTDAKSVGAWVFGFYLDGDQEQQPVIIGEIDGMGGKFSGEPSTSRLYRENPEGTVIQTIKDNLIDGQPEPAYATKKPYNHVLESKEGHAIELDDTPDAERVNIAHKNGTYIEMRPDGSYVNKVVKDNYTVIAGDDHVKIVGNVDVQVQGNVNINVQGNVTAQVGGNLIGDVKGSLALSSGGGNCSISFGNISMNGNVTMNGNMTINGKSEMNGHTTLHGVSFD